MDDSTNIRPDAPAEAALALVTERFPDAVAAFLCGSTARGEGTSTSDLDIVVVVPTSEDIYRESLAWRGWPVELFVHTVESVRVFLALDRRRGTGTMAFMLTHGLALLDREGVGERVRALGAASLAAGPEPVEASAVEDRRYAVTDLRDDLVGTDDEDELLAIAALLLERSAELFLIVQGRWRGGGKWLPRRLREADPVLAATLMGGYRTLVRGGAREPFADAVAALLDRCGGPRWEGHRRVAPVEPTGP